MRGKLREYIDSLFYNAPHTKKTVEVKEEILQNITEKYDDHIAQGKSEEAAYNIAIASVGDISELLEELKAKSRYTDGELSEQKKQERQKSALLTAIAVALYILCPVPAILLHGNAGPVLLFVMCAIATALLIYNHMSRSNKEREYDSLADEFKEWRESTGGDRQTFKAISSALWAITVVIYVLVSFTTHAWHITWVIFLISVAVNNIIRALFDLRK